MEFNSRVECPTTGEKISKIPNCLALRAPSLRLINAFVVTRATCLEVYSDQGGERRGSSSSSLEDGPKWDTEEAVLLPTAKV